MDILDSMTPAQLRDKIERLESAIRRAQACLIDGRRVGDALQILKVACPIVQPSAHQGGPDPMKTA